MFSAMDHPRRGSDRKVTRRRKPVSRDRRPYLERLEDYQLLSVFTVTTTANTGAGSFRNAWNGVANDTSGTAEVIKFQIPASGVQTITFAPTGGSTSGKL